MVNARCFAMLAKTKSRRSSQDFYRMASLAGTFEHLSSRISKIVHFLASLHRLILLYPLYYMGRYGGKERKIGIKVTIKFDACEKMLSPLCKYKIYCFQFAFVLFVNLRDCERGCFFLNFLSVSFFKAADPLCSSSSLVNVYTSVPGYPSFTPIGH